MSISKNRNKQLKSEFLKTYWKVYKEWMEIRKVLGFEGIPGEFSKRLIRQDTWQQLKGKM